MSNGNICVNCKYYFNDVNKSIDSEYKHLCSYNVIHDIIVNVITGEKIPGIFDTCQYMRYEKPNHAKNHCGLAGTLYAPQKLEKMNE